MARILIVDDQAHMRATLSAMLTDAGHEIDEAGDGDTACAMVVEQVYDLVLTDLRMGDTDGLDVLKRAKETSPLTEVVMMTAYGTIESAVEAMRVGAHDYVQKPFSEEELLVKVQRALRTRSLAGQLSAMAAEFRERYHFDNIIGRSAAIRDVLGRIVRVASTDATVLITGESGTGKELVARAVHANSPRSDKPFVSINCAAISETLLESELFGHVRGAFTGATQARKGLIEEANGGTFFFDEIAETPPSFQAKLLRAIQEREVRRLGDNKPIVVDVRVVAATNKDLQHEVSEGRFREDLYYRLNVIRFMLPPLRERREDIPLLAEHFIREASQKMNREAKLTEEALKHLVGHDFPGNVRELQNMISQGVALSADGRVRARDLADDGMSGQRRIQATDDLSGSLQQIVDKVERRAITKALVDAAGDKEVAASSLGLSATTLWRKMKRLKVVWK